MTPHGQTPDDEREDEERDSAPRRPVMPTEGPVVAELEQLRALMREVEQSLDELRKHTGAFCTAMNRFLDGDVEVKTKAERLMLLFDAVGGSRGLFASLLDQSIPLSNRPLEPIPLGEQL